MDNATTGAASEGVTAKPAEAKPGVYLTTPEACALLNISKPTLLRWARRFRARQVKVGACVRWPRKELDKMMESASRQVR